MELFSALTTLPPNTTETGPDTGIPSLCCLLKEIFVKSTTSVANGGTDCDCVEPVNIVGGEVRNVYLTISEL